jgi:hypothetical protein
VKRLLPVACALLSLLPAIALANGTAAPGVSGPRPDLLALGLEAFARVEAAGRVRNRVLTLIDYALPSSRRRLWVLEPGSRRILFHEYVAHGRGSTRDADPERAVWFGNQPGSLRSSLGTFLTGDSYAGMHGYSLRLEGLDPGVNDLAEQRRIVVHPAEYVSGPFRLRNGGRLGRSWGCPALDPDVAPQVIDRIRAGSVLFARGPAR